MTHEELEKCLERQERVIGALLTATAHQLGIHSAMCAQLGVLFTYFGSEMDPAVESVLATHLGGILSKLSEAVGVVLEDETMPADIRDTLESVQRLLGGYQNTEEPHGH